MKITNENAYDVPLGKRVTIEIDLVLDPVAGTWHQPEDFMQWACTHSYVKSATLVGLPEENT